MRRPIGTKPKIAARWTGSFEARTLKQRPNKSKPGRKLERKESPGPTARIEPTTMLSPRRKWLFRFCALVVIPLLLLGGLEAALRLGGYGYHTGFFEKIRVGQKEHLVNNENFSMRFFPPQLARWPGPVMMEARKPTNTYRIFILGESAARGEPEPPCAASRYLEVLLSERFPDTRFEIVNLGIAAINSHVILPIARDCARDEGDLWIIYMGNNEMLGPFGAATVFGAKAPPLGFVRLNLAIQRTRIGQLLVNIGRKLKGKNSNASWGGMKMFLGNQLRADDPRKEVVYQNFERNLHDIVRAGLDSGAKILLNTVAVNLKDCPPFASLINSNLPAADRAQFDKLYSEACQAQSQTNFVEAAQKFEQAARLDAQFPELQFRWGECLARMTNFAAAREHFQKACDDDTLPFRADSRVNGAIQETGRRLASERLVLFDAAAALETNTLEGLCGQEIFYGHVHFNFDGNYRLVRTWAEQVEKMLPNEISHSAGTNGWATQETCEQRLALTDWNHCAVVESVLDRLHRPPLNGQLNQARRLELLRVEAQELRRRMNPGTAAKAAEIYLDAIKRSPQDHLLVENFAEFLESAGDVKQAAVQWQRVCELLPHNCAAFYQLGRLRGALGQWPEAGAALSKAVELRPRLTEGWYELGNVNLGTEKFELALQDYEHAARLEPSDATYCSFVGKALSKLNRRTEAIQRYRQALQLQPDLWETHFALGDELAGDNKIAEAGKEYEEVVRLKPNNALAHLDLGVMQARLGQFDDALRQFAETLRLEPGNQQAREYIDRVQGWKNRKR
jgi:tetratricopeptide (TPR) repeat protein